MSDKQFSDLQHDDLETPVYEMEDSGASTESCPANCPRRPFKYVLYGIVGLLLAGHVAVQANPSLIEYVAKTPVISEFAGMAFKDSGATCHTSAGACSASLQLAGATCPSAGASCGAAGAGCEVAASCEAVSAGCDIGGAACETAGACPLCASSCEASTDVADSTVRPPAPPMPEAVGNHVTL